MVMVDPDQNGAALIGTPRSRKRPLPGLSPSLMGQSVPFSAPPTFASFALDSPQVNPLAFSFLNHEPEPVPALPPLQLAVDEPPDDDQEPFMPTPLFMLGSSSCNDDKEFGGALACLPVERQDRVEALELPRQHHRIREGGSPPPSNHRAAICRVPTAGGSSVATSGSTAADTDIAPRTPRIGEAYQASIDPCRPIDDGHSRDPLLLWKPGMVDDEDAAVLSRGVTSRGLGSAEIEHALVTLHMSVRKSVAHYTGDTKLLEGLADLDSHLDSLRRDAREWNSEEVERYAQGVHAFRRQFGKIQRFFLPDCTQKDLINYFYRAWKLLPGYREWKAKSLVGRKVLKGFSDGSTAHGVLMESFSREETEDGEELFSVEYLGRDGPFTEQLYRGEVEPLLLPPPAGEQH
jgi:hypothetical protein